MQCSFDGPNYWPPPQLETAIAVVGLEGVEPLYLPRPAFRKRNTIKLGMVDPPIDSCVQGITLTEVVAY